MFYWKNMPKSIPAKLSLRGLIVPDAEPDGLLLKPRVYPWGRVEYMGETALSGRWLVYDENGNRARVGTRPIALSILGTHARQISIRAQKRHFKNALKHGPLRVVATYRSRSVVDWAMLLASACLVLYVLVWVIQLSLRGLREGMFPPEYESLVVIVALLFVIVTAALGVVPAWLILPALLVSPKVLCARYDEHGISARLSDGTEVQRSWSSLKRVSRAGMLLRLHFDDGLALQIRRPGPRTVLFIQTVRAAYLSEQDHRDLSRVKYALVRSLLWCVLGAIGAALLVERYGGPDESSWSSFEIAGVILVAGLLLTIQALYMAMVPKWLAKDAARSYRKKRRARRQGR